MLKKMTGLFIVILVMGLQIGCSADVRGNEDQLVNITTETVEDDTINNMSIPHEEHLYSKSSASFAWEWSKTEDLPPEITDKYQDLQYTVPGGFVMKETPTDYFICVSIGKKESATEGFKVRSLTLLDVNQESNPSLVIEVTPLSNENNSFNKTEEKVFVRSLISVSKKDLPDGYDINSISLLGI